MVVAGAMFMPRKCGLSVGGIRTGGGEWVRCRGANVTYFAYRIFRLLTQKYIKKHVYSLIINFNWISLLVWIRDLGPETNEILMQCSDF